MRKMSFGILLVVIMMFAAVQAQAFDGERKGFILNLGAGYGQADGDGGGDSESGLATDFKLGAGINSQVAVYYTNRVVFFSPELSDDTFYTGMSAVGVSYFLNPQAPSFFFSGAVGIGVLASTANGYDSQSGTGFSFGAGFEFAQNWIVEANYMSASVGDFDYGINNLTLTLSWFAY